MVGQVACRTALAHAMRTMSRFQDDARIVESATALFVVGKSRFPTPYSNVAFPLDEGVDPDSLIGSASACFSDRRYFLWAYDALARALEPIASARGFIPFGTVPGMLIEKRVDTRERAGIDVSRVTDESAFTDFVYVSQRAYAEVGLPKEIAELLLAKPDAALGVADVFVARQDSEPIAAALSITNPETGLGGVYWVGTIPEARGKGAADAVTRAVTNAAFDRGASVVTLEASQLGEPVYLRMGYREVCRYLRMVAPQPSKD
jgi:ribosomal protein S18 acetylase RimI-like enzyme